MSTPRFAENPHAPPLLGENDVVPDQPPSSSGAPTSPHRELLRRHQAVLPSWLTLYYDEPLELVSGEGRHVVDGEGNRYLDFFGGILTTSAGHNVPEVVEAIREQAGRMLHSSTLYLIRPMIELAERIAQLSTIPDAKVFFVNSGTEAVETALMLSCTARSSNQVLAVRHSYHGRSYGTMSVTGNRAWSASSLSPFSVSYVHGGYRLRSPFGPLSDREFTRACVRDLREVIETTTAGDVACMIAEPIQGVGGFIVPPDGFFGAMKNVLDEYGILFVSDEVQTGWGRTGEHFWGFEAHDLVPDLAAFAKGLGNGLAIGGVVGRGDLVDSVGANSISTFGGNPLAASGALANLDYLAAPRPSGQCPQGGQLPPARARDPRRRARRGGGGAGEGAHDRRRARRARHHGAESTGGAARTRNVPPGGAADRHRGLARERPADRSRHECDAGRSRGGARDPDPCAPCGGRRRSAEGDTMNHITHWIDGKPWVGDAERRGTVFDPATGRQTGEVDLAADSVVDEAVAAARQGVRGVAVHLAGHPHDRALRPTSLARLPCRRPGRRW